MRRLLDSIRRMAAQCRTRPYCEPPLPASRIPSATPCHYYSPRIAFAQSPEAPVPLAVLSIPSRASLDIIPSTMSRHEAAASLIKTYRSDAFCWSLTWDCNAGISPIHQCLARIISKKICNIQINPFTRHFSHARWSTEPAAVCID